MDFLELQKICKQLDVVALVLPNVYCESGGKRHLWPAGPAGWVKGTVRGMDTLVEFDSANIMAYARECSNFPRIDRVRLATKEDYEFLQETIEIFCR